MSSAYSHLFAISRTARSALQKSGFVLTIPEQSKNLIKYI